LPPPDERRASALSDAIVVTRNAQSAALPTTAAHRLPGCVDFVLTMSGVGGSAKRLMLNLIMSHVSFFYSGQAADLPSS
jgi:hypothetical protein